MIKLAVFDLDGTLLDTLDDLTDAVNHAMASAGFATRTRERVREIIGNGVYRLIQDAVPAEKREDAALLDEIIAVYRAYYASHQTDKTAPYPGVLELLTALKEKGITTAVLSNKPHDNTIALVEEYFPGLIDLAYGQREKVPRKPDPAALLNILVRAGAEKSETAYIGDSDVDIETGLAAGVVTIGVTWGFRDRDALLEAGGREFAETSDELLKKILAI
ncbi:MAG: HAD family hydrolase [Oscillospiraceae bacterium]